MIKRIVYLVLVLLVTSCKSTKTIAGNTVIPMSSKKIINKHYESNFNKKTINATIKARYADQHKTQTISIKLRMQKDSAIWMSGRFLGIPMAKIYITPSKVLFYEKLSRQYFEGDFGLLSNFLGTEVDFDIIQNILLGEAIINLKDQKFESEIVNNTYKLSPKEQHELFDLFFWMNPVNFKLDKQEVRQPSVQKKMMIDYVEYQNLSDVVFPKLIRIIAIDKVDRVFLDLEYKAVEFDKRVSFPFEIPSGYDQIHLNE